MKYFLIAGETSGDMHASRLMEEIQKLDSHAEFAYFGGDAMQAIGGKLLKHIRQMAFMGILPVLLNIKKVMRNFRDCEREVLSFKPSILILIDYPGFNLRMAKFAKQNNIPTAYYISPKVWAWKTRRVHKIKAFVDQMYCILPFEEQFYKKYNYQTKYVGNPVWDYIQDLKIRQTNHNTFCKNNNLTDKPIIALLAGSRMHEIKSLLPPMEKIIKHYPDYQFIIAGAPGIDEKVYKAILRKPVAIVQNQTHELLRNSKAAIVSSGTATLETALLDIPQIVVYKMGFGAILKILKPYLLKTKFFSLVNLIAEQEIVKEFFHDQVNEQNLKEELGKILNDNSYRLSMLNGYAHLQNKIATPGAAKTTAKHIFETINGN